MLVANSLIEGGFLIMLIRSSKIEDSQTILDVLTEAYTKTRYDVKFAPNWIECFINNPSVFPSYVVEDENKVVAGYIVWRVRQLSADHQTTLELQELAARNGSKKIAVEKLLFNESPLRVIKHLEEKGFNVGEICNLDVWIHDDDRHNNSVIYSDGEKGKFLGGFEKSDARGEMLLLYRRKYEHKKIKR